MFQEMAEFKVLINPSFRHLPQFEKVSGHIYLLQSSLILGAKGDYVERCKWSWII